MDRMSQRDRDALDRYITGDYGERQFANEFADDELDICSKCGRVFQTSRHAIDHERDCEGAGDADIHSASD